MVKIRLTRMGKKGAPIYRIVASDSRKSRDGQYLELIGTYNPGTKTNDKAVTVDEEKALKWLNNGAQPTDTVRNLLSEAGVMKKFSEQKQGSK